MSEISLFLQVIEIIVLIVLIVVLRKGQKDDK